MTPTITRNVSTAPRHSLGYWTVMVGGIAALVVLYAGILLFGHAW